MRILQLCAVDFTVRQFLLPLVDGLTALGHTVDIACSPGPYFPELQQRGYRMIPNSIDRSLHAGKHAVAILRTAKLLRRGKYDVLHVHTPIAALVGRIAAFIARVRIRIYTAHGFYFHDDMSPMKKRIFVTLEKIGAFCGHQILCVSDEDRQNALKLRITSPDGIETIHNGIDAAHYSPARFDANHRQTVRQKLGIPLDSKVIAIVGRLVREKGFMELVDALPAITAQCPNASVMVLGDELPSDHDGVKQRFLERATELGVRDRIFLAGLVPDTAPWLAAADVFTLPSWREGMPISLLEGMAMQLPCVTTDVRGCREEVVHGESGWIVPARESAPLASALLEALNDHDEAARRAKAARQRVLDMFEIHGVVAHQIRIYERLQAQLLKPGHG